MLNAGTILYYIEEIVKDSRQTPSLILQIPFDMPGHVALMKKQAAL